MTCVWCLDFVGAKLWKKYLRLNHIFNPVTPVDAVFQTCFHVKQPQTQNKQSEIVITQFNP
jgi:hypothetical protein